MLADAEHNMQQVIQVARDGINTVVTVSRRDGKRPHSSVQRVTWSIMGELLTMCARIPLESLGVAVSDKMLSFGVEPGRPTKQSASKPGRPFCKGPLLLGHRVLQVSYVVLSRLLCGDLAPPGVYGLQQCAHVLGDLAP